MLISHDYLLAKGVKAALTEFFVNKPEPVIELTGDQCMIVRLGDGLSDRAFRSDPERIGGGMGEAFA